MSKNAYRALLTGVLFFSLVSCAHRPTPEELATADYGAYPNNYQEIVKGYFAILLKDPYSAQYELWKGPTQMWYSFFDHGRFGYGVCVGINAKNSYGGYTGLKVHYVLINNGVVVRHMSSDENQFIVQD